MGIQHNGIKFLLHAYRNGVCFDRSLTIGRLMLRSQKHQLQDLLVANGFRKALDYKWVEKLSTEDVLSLLGASDIDSIDYSDYQDCTIVHDLNNPLPKEYHRQYDAVIEGGTIEHVFNAPLALQSCMDSVKNNGRIYIMQNGPGFYGHGFYTFCPEFFFRALSPEYGFEIELALLYESSNPDKVYEIQDPLDTRDDLNIVTDSPATILIQAKRIGEGKGIIESPPNQSGYESLWRVPNEKWTKGIVSGEKNKKHSVLHGLRWYELWKWNRHRRRHMKRRKKNSYLGGVKYSKQFSLDA